MSNHPQDLGKRIMWLFAVVVALVPITGARGTDDDMPFNAPANCPYCEGDAEQMEMAGIVSHGGFLFGSGNTETIDDLLPNVETYWIESEHFEVGLAVGFHKVKSTERKKVRAELTRLNKVLPKVKPSTKVLDPWLRTHLYAQRLEDIYTEFLGYMGIEQSQFPDGIGAPWIVGNPYFGEGPHVGQAGKYELLLLPNAEQQVLVIHTQFGLQVRHPQKWNITETDSLFSVINLSEDSISGDEHLHNVVIFHTIHNLVDGYKHYSYDTPQWIKEGLAHYAERRMTPRFNTFSFSEGGIAQEVNDKKWAEAAKKQFKKDAMPRMAEMIGLRSFSEWERLHHLASWSMVSFMLDQHPEAFAKINAKLHGIKGKDNYPDGSKMPDKHRAAITEFLGMNYRKFDTAWKAWALSR